ncbi:MAG: hypothetical protein JXA21_24860 [Anaerolineae bacterium]|nr:hypothetical protein [Anaerolineae bacterium]
MSNYYLNKLFIVCLVLLLAACNSEPHSYTIQVSGTKAYVLDAGQLTGAVADHLDFRFERNE